MTPDPLLYTATELALAEFGEDVDTLVFAASSQARAYLDARMKLRPFLRDPTQPYHAAACDLWTAIDDAARRRIRDLLCAAEPSESGAAELSVEDLLAVAALRSWPDVATGVLLAAMQEGERWAVVQAGNIDQNSDFLGLHLRGLLTDPAMREPAMRLMLLLFIQTTDGGQGRLYESPAGRHLAAAFALGEVVEDELADALDRAAESGEIESPAVRRTLDALRHTAARYVDLLSAAEPAPSLAERVARSFHRVESKLAGFLRTDDEDAIRWQARDLMGDAETARAVGHRLIRLAYLDPDAAPIDRHRAQERLMALCGAHAERLLEEPERTLAEWLDPHALLGAERDVVLTAIAIEDLRSGGAAAWVLRGALQNPLYADAAMGLMIETIFRNPPGALEEQLLQAISSGELGPAALSRVGPAAEEVLGPRSAAWFMESLQRRLACAEPGGPTLPFRDPMLTPHPARPFLATTRESRALSSCRLLTDRMGVPVPDGLRATVSDLFDRWEAEEILPRYGAVVDPEPLLQLLRTGDRGMQEVVRQMACDLAMLHEAIQRMGREGRRHGREHLAAILLLRAATVEIEAAGAIRPGQRAPNAERQGALLDMLRARIDSVRREDERSGHLWPTARRRIREWANERLGEILRRPWRPLMFQMLEDPYDEVQRRAAEAVRREPDWVPELGRMLASDHPAVRLAALRGLAGSRDPAIRRQIAERLAEPEEIGDAAAEALGGWGTALVTETDPEVVARLGHELLRRPLRIHDPEPLRAALKQLTSRSGRTDRETLALNWAARIGARMRDSQVRALARAAAQNPGPAFPAAVRAEVTRWAGYGDVEEAFESRGAEAALREADAHASPRLAAVMRRVDEYQTQIRAFQSAPAAPGTRYSSPTAMAPILDPLLILSAAAGGPRDEDTGRQYAWDALRQLYVRSLELAPELSEVERALVNAGVHLTGRSHREILGCRAQLADREMRQWERATLAVLWAASGGNSARPGSPVGGTRTTVSRRRSDAA